MCGMFLLEDSKSIVDMLVAQGKDRAAMEKELSWYFHSAPQSSQSYRIFFFTKQTFGVPTGFKDLIGQYICCTNAKGCRFHLVSMPSEGD